MKAIEFSLVYNIYYGNGEGEDIIFPQNSNCIKYENFSLVYSRETLTAQISASIDAVIGILVVDLLSYLNRNLYFGSGHKPFLIEIQGDYCEEEEDPYTQIFNYAQKYDLILSSNTLACQVCGIADTLKKQMHDSIYNLLSGLLDD